MQSTIIPYINCKIKYMVNPSIMNICEYSSNAPGSIIQLMREDTFLKRLQNVVPNVINNMMPYTCHFGLYVKHESTGVVRI